MTIRDLFKDEAELAKFQSDIHRDKYGAQKMLLCGTWQNIARLHPILVVTLWRLQQ